MSRDDGGAAGTVVVAFVLGAITGAAVALLLAPASGEETRRILGEKAKEGREKATDAARQGREFLNRQRDTIAHRHRSRARRLQPGADRRAAGTDRGESVNLSETFLGVIAAATLLMALIQVGAIVVVLAHCASGAADDRRRAARRETAHREGDGGRRGSIADGDTGHRPGAEDRSADDRFGSAGRPDCRRCSASHHHAGPRRARHRRSAQGRVRVAARLPRAAPARPGRRRGRSALHRVRPPVRRLPD